MSANLNELIEAAVKAALADLTQGTVPEVTTTCGVTTLEGTACTRKVTTTEGTCKSHTAAKVAARDARVAQAEADKAEYLAKRGPKAPKVDNKALAAFLRANDLWDTDKAPKDADWRALKAEHGPKFTA